MELFAEALTCVTFVWKVIGSNLGWDISNFDRYFSRVSLVNPDKWQGNVENTTPPDQYSLNY
jgi:hypothetical protein